MYVWSCGHMLLLLIRVALDWGVIYLSKGSAAVVVRSRNDFPSQQQQLPVVLQGCIGPYESLLQTGWQVCGPHENFLSPMT